MSAGWPEGFAVWLKIDNGWSRHPKVMSAGLHGRALWLAAADEVASRNGEGLVQGQMIRVYAVLAEVNAKRACLALVEAGLWHDHETIRSCARCREAAGELAPGDYYFHDWLDYQFTKDEASLPPERRKRQRKDALHRDKLLLAAILERDGTLCRYCGGRVNFRDRRGRAGGTYDHVNPDGPNSLENVVVACRGCNGKKGDRTPDEAGMPLRPVQAHLALVSGAGSGANLLHNESGSGVDLLTGDQEREDGADQIGNGSATGSEQIGAGS